jgi:hypothetical protein
MAQVRGDSFYDWNWHHQWMASLRLLLDLASAWAMGHDVPVTQGIAAVIQVLALRLSSVTSPSPRPLRLRLSTLRPLEEELLALRPNASPQSIERAATALTRYMEEIKVAWSEGMPLEPDEKGVLRSMVGILFDLDVVRKPPVKGTW